VDLPTFGSPTMPALSIESGTVAGGEGRVNGKSGADVLAATRHARRGGWGGQK
jgi:hypothetical protein